MVTLKKSSEYYLDITFIIITIINPFVPNAPFLYPLKTSENPKVFGCFLGVEKGCIGSKWVSVDIRHPLEY